MTDTTTATVAAAIASNLWKGMSKNERSLVRFGIFPAGKMEQGEAELREHAGRDTCRLLAVALMDEAKRDGGMIA